MATPLTYVALQTIQGYMSSISVVNGYHTDVGANTTLEPFQMEADEAVEALSIVEDDDEVASKTTESRQSVINVILEAYVPITEENSQLRAHQIREDILRALPTKTRNWPKGIYGVDVMSRKILQRPQGFSYTVVQIRVQLQLNEAAVPPT